ncbi:hypothetical protein IKE_06290 [Bacillus cereus VD196]|uniref:DUF418 domain-containing protein n=1 Tax=Bacillus cereus VD196 TaxID=1053243 RepID=A0A9W5PXP9_BACCE|nr:DUF418 domain-containing protein [Bacillus cereus]EOO57802.1 hypothetical protein IKE_06290 [Bacillus cereus VD196]
MNNNRIDILDYLRGFALMGILLVNIINYLDMRKPPIPNSIDEYYQRFLYLFVEGHFYTIFTFLFGVGFYIFITRAKEKGANAYLLFIRRLIALFIMGSIHSIFHSGEALTNYAAFGFILLPFYKIKKQINLVLGVLSLSGAVGAIFFGFGDKLLLNLPLFILGLTAGQYRIFENISENVKKYQVFTVMVAVLGSIGLWFHYMYIPPKLSPMLMPYANDPDIQASTIFLQIGIVQGLFVSAFYIGILVILLQNNRIQKLLCPLKYYGRMALTNYIGQTALMIVSGYLFQLEDTRSYFYTLFICIGIYIIQLLFSMAWLRFFKMGPLEWLWRICTYWKVISIRK